MRVRTHYDAATAEILYHLGIDVVVMLGYLYVVTEPLLLEKGLDEDVAQVLARIQKVLGADLPEHTVAVSHGDTIALAVGLLTGAPPELPANGSITPAPGGPP